MVYIGMIFQCDSEQKSGVIMYSDGKQEVFNSTHWLDTEVLPKVGQKVSFEYTHSSIQIKPVNQDEIITTSPEENVIEDQEGHEPKTLNDYIEHYTNMGFKLVPKPKNKDLDTTILRLYTASDYGEAVIKVNGSGIVVTQTINGETTVIE